MLAALTRQKGFIESIGAAGGDGVVDAVVLFERLAWFEVPQTEGAAGGAGGCFLAVEPGGCDVEAVLAGGGEDLFEGFVGAGAEGFEGAESVVVGFYVGDELVVVGLCVGERFSLGEHGGPELFLFLFFR